ncbi:MAG: sensor histidine kinase [Oscillospiraceae bacterium]
MADTGSGIAPEDLPHVFGAASPPPDGSGEGLGLYIVRTFALEHGGRASESQPGKGSTFKLHLPLA